MFLQETNIDKNYVPGKIRTTWVDTKLYLPPPSSDSKDRVFYVTGILYCFSAGFRFENSFFLIDDRGYRPGMLNCKEILSPYLFWLSVVICTYKYMYNIVIGFFYRNHETWESRINDFGHDFIYDWSVKSAYLLSRVYSYLWPVEVWTNLRICVEYECIICSKQYSKEFVK